MVYLLLIFVIVLTGFQLVGIFLSTPRYRGPVSDHFDGKKFINPGNEKAKGLIDVLRWLITRKRGEWTLRKKPIRLANDLKPVKGMRITFVNHSTFLVQVQGLNILTDPVWSERTSPFKWAGPKRTIQPGINFEDLPKIDLILLSHNHYDHLDIHTLRLLYKKYRPKIITALGVNAFLQENRIDTGIDLDWWEEIMIRQDVAVQSVPAQHFSGRGSLDRDTSLWCGFILKSGSGNIYFAGDTGYNDKTFNEIGMRCGPFVASLIPIGAYKPRWFMRPIHCSPEEAVMIHKEVNSQLSIATHFGTFPLADDSWDDPTTDLKIALAKKGLSENSFLVMQEGESIELK